jgi:serine/threonine-protein kinase SRPK3
MKFWTAEDVYKYLGEPVKIPINDAGESAPPDAVVPMDPTKLRDFCLSEKSTIKIIDFGQSFLSTDEVLPDKITTPLPITAPEILLGKRHIGPAIDVWAFGCTLFQILGNNQLFDPFLNSKNQLLVEFVRTMGKLPDEWWGEWEERANFFDEDGNVLPGKVLYGRSGTISMSERLESVVLRDDEPVASGLEESEIKVLLDILERIFAAYEPEKRIRASEIAKTLPKTWDA